MALYGKARELRDGAFKCNSERTIGEMLKLIFLLLLIKYKQPGKLQKIEQN